MSKLSNEEIMSNIYYDLETGYGSKQSLYNQAQEKGASVILEEVAKWLKKQPNKQIKPYQNYNSFLVPYARAEFQIDIMDMKIFKKEDEEHYALIVIDAFSKLGFVYPMFQRDSSNVLKGLKEAFKVMGEPVEIFSDDDGAFKAEVKKYLDDLDTIHKTTVTHANIVERLIRTMKKGIGDRMHFTKGRWTDMLKPTLKKYNSAIHSSTGMKLNEAHDDDNRINVQANFTLKQKHIRKYPKLSVPDTVKLYQKGKGNYTSYKETKMDRKEIQNRKDRKRYNITNILCIRRFEETIFET